MRRTRGGGSRDPLHRSCAGAVLRPPAPRQIPSPGKQRCGAAAALAPSPVSPPSQGHRPHLPPTITTQIPLQNHARTCTAPSLRRNPGRGQVREHNQLPTHCHWDTPWDALGCAPGPALSWPGYVPAPGHTPALPRPGCRSALGCTLGFTPGFTLGCTPPRAGCTPALGCTCTPPWSSHTPARPRCSRPRARPR